MTAKLTMVKWTVEDYHRMIHAGILSDRRAELLWGEIVALAPEGKPHAHLSSVSVPGTTLAGRSRSQRVSQREKAKTYARCPLAPLGRQSQRLRSGDGYRAIREGQVIYEKSGSG